MVRAPVLGFGNTLGSLPELVVFTSVQIFTTIMVCIFKTSFVLGRQLSASKPHNRKLQNVSAN